MDAVRQAFWTLWSAGVVHGDIHPGNVLVRRVGQREIEVKIFDLGLATCYPSPATPSERLVDERRLAEYSVYGN